jgi:hypothetical protein
LLLSRFPLSLPRPAWHALAGVLADAPNENAKTDKDEGELMQQRHHTATAATTSQSGENINNSGSESDRRKRDSKSKANQLWPIEDAYVAHVMKAHGMHPSMALHEWMWENRLC